MTPGAKELPDALDELPMSRAFAQEEALDSVRAACTLARELGVDAVIYGSAWYDELVVHDVALILRSSRKTPGKACA